MPFFSTINIYLNKAFLRYLALGTFGISFLILVFEGIEMLRRSMGRPNVPFRVMLEMIILKLPNHLQILLPLIVLLVMLFLTWHLTSFREFIAMQNAGIGRRLIIKGLSIALLAVGVFYIAVLNPMASMMHTRYLELESDYFKSTIHRMSISENGLWIRENSDDVDRIVHIRKLLPQKFFDVTFYQYSKSSIYINRWDAKEVALSKGKWSLKEASKWGAGDNILPKIELKTDLTWAKIQAGTMPASSISFWQLPEFIKLMDKAGLSSHAYRISFAGHIMRFLSLWVMAAVAITCMLIPPRGGKLFKNFTLALVLGFAWYIIGDIFQALALVKKMNLFLALMLPSAILLLFCCFILLHQRQSIV